MWGEKKELRGSLYIIGGCASLQRRLHTHTQGGTVIKATIEHAEVLDRCDSACSALWEGRKVVVTQQQLRAMALTPAALIKILSDGMALAEYFEGLSPRRTWVVYATRVADRFTITAKVK